VKRISRRQWEGTHKDYKHVTNGQRYILEMGSRGTRLVPVVVIGMKKPPKTRRKKRRLR